MTEQRVKRREGAACSARTVGKRHALCGLETGRPVHQSNGCASWLARHGCRSFLDRADRDTPRPSSRAADL